MFVKATKSLSFFLIVAFLVTGLGSLLGCVWCDNGCLSKTHLSSHIDDHSNKHTDLHTAEAVDIHTIVAVGDQIISLDQHHRSSGDSCVDALIQLGDSLVEEHKLADFDAVDMLDSSFTRLQAAVTADSPGKKINLHQPPRISQTILSHRTVVLLS